MSEIKNWEHKRWMNYLALVLSLFCIGRWFYYTDLYSVNILYADLWDFYTPAFEGAPWWEFFLYQHGPHRQGIGFVLTHLLDQISGWNTRVLAFAVGVLLSLSALIYWRIKRRFEAEAHWSAVLVFVLLLLPSQFELFTGAINLSHGAIPVFLLSLSCLSFFIRSIYWRHIVLVVLNFFLVFSAFGLAMGFVLPIILLLEGSTYVRSKNWKLMGWCALSFLLSLLPWFLFFQNYTLEPAAPDFAFPHPRPWEYAQFIALALGGLFSITHDNWLGQVPGFFLFALALTVLAKHGIALLRKENSGDLAQRQVILTLLGFSLIFIALTAVGRISFGLSAGRHSRYLPYLIPLLLGLYFHLIGFVKRKRTWLWTFFALMALVSVFNGAALNQMSRSQEQRSSWKATYLETRSIEKADSASGMRIHPDPKGTNLQEKLDFLEERELNLFIPE